jgi:osmotically-inducible protein OsmY
LPNPARTVAAATLLTFAVLATACGRSDANIERDVRSRLVVDNTTSGMDVTITAVGGTVHLAGVVRAKRQYDRALQIASEVVGADKVRNEMRLDEHPLAVAVQAAVKQDPLVANVPLDIDVSGPGVVVLRSNRTTEEQRTRLVQIAHRVSGVSRVDAYMK